MAKISIPKKPPRPNPDKIALTNVEKIIGAGLADGMKLKG
jgi:hypothetical protein